MKKQRHKIQSTSQLIRRLPSSASCKILIKQKLEIQNKCNVLQQSDAELRLKLAKTSENDCDRL